MPEIRFSKDARNDLRSIFEFIAADNPHRAMTYVGQIEDHCSILSRFPSLGRARDDLGPGIRLLLFEGSVVIVYRVEGDFVEIDRIFHGGRDFESLLRG